MVEQFGAKTAAELWTRIPEALSTAINREVNAHPTTAQAADRVLTNPRWALPYEELVHFLGNLPGAQVLAVPKSVYQLIVLRGHVLLPWCYGQSARDSMRDAQVGRSFGRLAREMLSRLGTPWRRSLTEPALPLDAIDEREVAKICMAIVQLEPTPDVVIAGYTSTAHHGLLRACLGEVKTAENDCLNWRHLADLPLPPPVIPRPHRLEFPCSPVEQDTTPWDLRKPGSGISP